MDDARGATTAAPTAEPNPRTDRLELLQQLPGGSVGMVHKARNPKLNRTVALRQLLVPEWLDDSADLIKRILAEARAASGLDHANIARLFTGGYKGFNVFLTSEFVEGQNVKEFLASRSLTVAEILAVGKQLCAALEYAHQRNVLHHALTPANLKVLPDGTLKVLDFGLLRDKHLYSPTPAKRLESEHYLSPEQLKGKPVSQATNVFGVATILYELLTTRNPFAGKHLGEVDRNITEIDPPPASVAHARVSEAISKVLMKGLAKHPLARFQSCAEFGAALEEPSKAASAKAVSVPPAPPARPATPVIQTRPMIQPKPAVLPSPAAQPNPVSTPAVQPSSMVQPQPVNTNGGSSAPIVFGNGQSGPSHAPSEPVPQPRAVASMAKPAMAGLRSQAVLAPVAASASSSKMPARMLVQWKLVGGIIAAVFVVSAVAISLNHRSKSPVPPPVVAATVVAPTPAQAQPEVTEAAAVPEVVDTSTDTSVGPQIKVSRQRPVKTRSMSASVAATEGQLAISSEPDGASFSIEGHTLDSWKTPQVVGSLAPAVYKVTVSKPGYASESRNIQIVGGNRASLDVKLTAIKATLAVRGTPTGARIVIDGKETGKFSPADFMLDPAVHTVSLQKEGFFDSTENVKLSAGQTLNYSPSLTAAGRTDNIKVVGGFKKLFGKGSSSGAVTMEIKSEPKGAQISINGSILPKTTPVEIQVDPGNYEVTLQKEGYKSVHKMVNAQATDRVKVEETLQHQ